MQTETAERLLIFQNENEITRITSEAQSRADILNNLNNAGVTNEEIKTVCTSTNSIDSFIHKRVLSGNRELKKLEAAGIKVEYTIPENIQRVKYLLLAWFNFPGSRHSNKFENLIYTSKWEIDSEALENLFIRHQYKIFVEGEKLKEYKQLEFICQYLQEQRAPSNQIHENSFFHNRIQILGTHSFKPKWQYFRTDN